MLSKIVFIMVVVTAAYSVDITPVSRCTRNPGDLPLNVYINGCSAPPCLLPQLENAVLNVVFKAPRRLQNMETLATAYLLGVPIQYPLGADGVTCNDIQNSYCPLLEGEVVNYTLRMYIESFMLVGTQVPIEFRVVDQNSVPVFCFRTTVRIAPSTNSTLSIGEH